MWDVQVIGERHSVSVPQMSLDSPSRVQKQLDSEGRATISHSSSRTMPMTHRHLAILASITITACTTFALLAQPDDKATPAKALPVKTLPIKTVVLTNSGLGYFKREGVVDGPTRVELKVIEEDVNDLILTLLVNDPNGKTPTVQIENRAPADLTLKAFKIDVTENPTVGQLLSQVRGEEVKIAFGENKTITGRVVSVTTNLTTHTSTDTETLTLLTAEGLTAIPVNKLTSTKFLNAEVQAEFTKVLLAVAAARGEAKKTVTIDLPDGGKRPVSLSYIADAPIWKPTYRLVLQGDKAKLIAQAAIENISEDDWEQVRLKLVNSRPVTYKMNLYDPLFVPREYVEPRMYASLRPPMYQASQMGAGVGQQFGQLGNIGGAGFGGGNLGVGGGALGNAALNQNLGVFGQSLSSIGMAIGKSQGFVRPTTRQLLYGQRTGVPPEAAPNEKAPLKVDLERSIKQPELGAPVEYAIADPLSLPRFKTAIVTMFTDSLESQAISIYNGQLMERHPMQGLKISNSSKQSLSEGPVAISVDDQLVGQAVLPDLNPGEYRILSYAIDLGVLVDEDFDAQNVTPVSKAIRTGNYISKNRHRDTTTFAVANSSASAKVVWVTVPKRDNWKLIPPAKPIETTPSYYRFEVKVPAKSTEKLTVVQEMDQESVIALAKLEDKTLDEEANAAATPPAVKAALAKIKLAKTTLLESDKTLKAEATAMELINTEQTRLRANMDKVPMASEVYKRYLKKFDEQETELETRQAKVKELTAKKQGLEKELAELLTTLKAE
jgi:hypothetical protein